MHRHLPFLPALLLLAAFIPEGWIALADAPTKEKPLAVAFRRPVAAVFCNDARTLAVANERSGTVSLVRLDPPRVVGEAAVGKGLADAVAVTGGPRLLVADDQTHELVVLRVHGQSLSMAARVAVSPYPAGIAVTSDGRRAVVAGLWSHRVDVIDLRFVEEGRLRVLHSVLLPFAPRRIAVLPGGTRAVVAAAHVGQIAVLDLAAGKLESVREIDGHNIAGILARPDRGDVLLSHQLLESDVPTTRENLEQGRLMANGIRRVPLAALLDPDADLDATSEFRRIGGPGQPSGDPAGLVALDDGGLAVALAGVQELDLLSESGRESKRVRVGDRPTVVLPTPDRKSLVVVNNLGDSLSVVDAVSGKVTTTLSLGSTPTAGYRERGERLFHDARLSLGGQMSCHSCHTDGHSNGRLADTLGDNTYGTPKRVLTLLGTRMTDPWGWNGSMQYLHDQVEKSLRQTMHTPGLTETTIGDLNTFLHNLPPPPPPEPATTDPLDRERLARGRDVFTRRGCVQCHIPPLTYSSHGTHNVDLQDEQGLGKFNAPSLRGVGHNVRFFHDNRAESLDEVFSGYLHPHGESIPPAERADLIRFLRSL